MEISLESRIRLNNGVEMPRIGLGTAGMTDVKTVSTAVQTALQIGYRLVDTSKNYENEEPVGMGIRQSGIKEAEIFLTTKLEKEDYGAEGARRGFEGSLKRLGVQKIDLYLIHAPEKDRKARVETWRALTEMEDGSRLRSVGVSNYEIEHLKEIEAAGLPVPAVNQIELHPFNYKKQRGLVEYCQDQGVVLTAYSPLGVGKILDHPLLVHVGSLYHKTPAQVLLRWGLQHNFVVIPKSDQEDHIRANLEVFDFILSSDEMLQLDSLSETGKRRV